jgi:hypothetical protein
MNCCAAALIYHPVQRHMLGRVTGKGSNQKPETRVALLPVPAQGERKNILFLVSMYSFQCFTMHETKILHLNVSQKKYFRECKKFSLWLLV